MSDGALSTLESVGEIVARGLEPVAAAVGAGGDDIPSFVAGLGWDLPNVPTGFADLTSAATKLLDAIAAFEAKRLDEATGAGSSQDVLEALGLVLFAVVALAGAIHGLPDTLRTQLPGGYLSESHIAEEIEPRIFDFAVMAAARSLSPTAFYVLKLIGLFEETEFDQDPAQHRTTFVLQRIVWDRFGKLFQDPAGLFKDVYGWGTPRIDVDRLFGVLQDLGATLLAPPSIDYPSLGLLGAVSPGTAVSEDDLRDPRLLLPLLQSDELTLSLGLFPLPKATPTDPQGLGLTIVVSGTLTELIPLADQLGLKIDAKVDLSPGLALGLFPDRAPQAVIDPEGTPVAATGRIVLQLVFGRSGAAAPAADEPQSDRTRLLGLSSGSRLEVRSLYLGGGAQVDTHAAVEAIVEAGVTGGRLVIAASENDSFLAKILPAGGITLDFDFGIGWSKSRGVYFQGGASLETTIALGLTLGPFHIDSLHVLFGIDAAHLMIEFSVSGGGALGPVAAAVDRIGISADLQFRAGNLGPVQLDIAFKPPDGLGLVIEAGPVTGGGFISFDPQNGRYAGVLQLKLYEIGITAIGLLDTKLPGGKPGFSFLLIIAVEFTPIQLGFGFTLNGVGGLAGINRTMVADELRQGVRQHSLENILFPQNPIARATQLISDLGRIFPPADGRYVFGPMVKLGWGTFVEAELGIIIELPSPVRIAILGEVNAYFPLKDEAIIEIHLDVLGIIDFGAQLFSLDASLHDSRVLLFGLSGDMAMRLSWGDDPSFAFSIGGLNPHFQPPPGFPTLRRLTLTLGDGDNPRLSLEGYFALTSNSFQFGAALSLYASLGELNVKGFLGFDALFIFSPFSFIIDFEADLDVTMGSLHLVGIHIHASLSGPTPWHIAGELSISLLFFDISVHVDFILGDERHDTLPEVDTWTPLQKAIVAQTSWEGVRPPLALQAVKLSALEGSAAPVLIDPVGGATLREKVLPLGQTITRFAEVNIAPVRYDLDSIVLVGTTIKPPAVEDHFAPGAFREMSDAEKISSPSFVWMQAGFTIASDAVALGGALTLGVQYTTRIVDAPDQRRNGQPYPISPAALLAAAEVAAAETGMRATGTARFAPDLRADPRAAMNDEEFVVASTENHKPQLTITPPTSKGLAQSALAQHLAANPEDRDRLQVMPAADVAA